MVYDKVAEVLLKMDGRRYIEKNSSPSPPFDQTPRCEIRRNEEEGRGRCKGKLYVYTSNSIYFREYFYLCCKKHLPYVTHRLTEWEG